MRAEGFQRAIGKPFGRARRPEAFCACTRMQDVYKRQVFTIAHRLTTIRGADTIWVLTENGVEEMGSHAELMKKGGLYAHLYEMYTEKGEETA